MNIIITGASRGIGYETVKFFARRPKTEIYAISRDIRSLEKLAGECTALNPDSVVHLLDIDLDKFIDDPDLLIKRLPNKDFHLDILINNAGKFIKKPFLDTSHKEAEEIFRVNCLAPALLVRHLKPFMGSDAKTHVVNIGSMAGYQGSKKFPGLVWYSVSKAALSCLTECMEEEFKDPEIAFNCLALGSVNTAMLEVAFPGFKAPVTAEEMGEFIGQFALTAHRFMKGRVVPVSMLNP